MAPSAAVAAVVAEKRRPTKARLSRQWPTAWAQRLGPWWVMAMPEAGGATREWAAAAAAALGMPGLTPALLVVELAASVSLLTFQGW